VCQIAKRFNTRRSCRAFAIDRPLYLLRGVAVPSQVALVSGLAKLSLTAAKPEDGASA